MKPIHTGSCEYFIQWRARNYKCNTVIFYLPVLVDGRYTIFGYWYVYEGGGCFAEESFKLVFNEAIDDIEHHYHAYCCLGEPEEYNSDTASDDDDFPDEMREIPTRDRELFKIVESSVKQWLHHIDMEGLPDEDWGESLDILPDKLPLMKPITRRRLTVQSPGMTNTMIALISGGSSSVYTFMYENNLESCEDAKQKLFDRARRQLTIPPLDLDKFEKYDPAQVRDKITKDPGLFIWFDRASGRPVYIDITNSRDGLHGLVIRQNLSPSYVESRPDRIKNAHAVGNSKDGRPVVEKSYFRKIVSEKYSLKPGSDCVEFIQKNFLIALCPMPGSSREDLVEYGRKILLAYRPEFNVLPD